MTSFVWGAGIAESLLLKSWHLEWPQLPVTARNHPNMCSALTGCWYIPIVQVYHNAQDGSYFEHVADQDGPLCVTRALGCCCSV